MGQWLSVCAHACTCVCACVCAHACMCVCTCIYACVCLCLCAYVWDLAGAVSIGGHSVGVGIGRERGPTKGCPWISGVIDLSIIKSKDEFFQTLGNS